jgi:hypothetical protein
LRLSRGSRSAGRPGRRGRDRRGRDVIGVKRASVVFGVVFGGLVFGERDLRRRLAGASLVLVVSC